jgi:hypothetical protein
VKGLSRRLRLRLLAGLLLLLALGGHVVYHYWPRARAAEPSLADLPGQILAHGEYDTVLWIPYPHQNLGAFQRHGVDVGTLLGSAAELADTAAPAVPHFGPFALPPAREMVLAVDREGTDSGRFLLAARVYPALATIARAAGRVADNPWLGGGIVEFDDRQVEVRWEGTLWMVVSPPGDPRSVPAIPPTTPEPLPAMLASLRLDTPVGILPQGRYSLTAAAGEARFALLGQGGEFPIPDGGDPSALRQDPVTLLAITGWADPRAWILFDHGGAFLSASGEDLEAAMLLAALLGEDGYRGKASGWEVQASGERNFRRAGFLVPDLVRLLEGWDAPRLRLAFAADPGAALEALGEVEEGLRRLGPPGEENEPLTRLVAFRQLATPLTRYSHLRILSVRGPDRFELVVRR